MIAYNTTSVHSNNNCDVKTTQNNVMNLSRNEGDQIENLAKSLNGTTAIKKYIIL